jgi:hypothetical protein
MKRINIKKLGVLCMASLSLLMGGCEGSIEGINTNPFAATNIDPSLLFPQIILAISQQRTIELNSVNIQAQHWTSGGSAGVFTNPERYIISANTTNNVWFAEYATALRNLQQVRLLTEQNNPGNLHVIGQAKVLEAFTFFNLTQVYGQVPFSEATQPADFPNPNFDLQEDVLRGVVTRCDEGIALLNGPSDAIVTGGDLIYGGDASKWIKFANTLKLQALMLIANVNPSSVQAELQALISQPLITTIADEAKLDYTAAIGNENPIWNTLNLFSGGTNIFWYSGATLVDLMNNLGDPRRATYFDLNSDGQYVGQNQGVLSPTGISPISLNIIRPEMPDRYASASETHFLLADAAANGLIPGGLAQANTYLQDGVSLSMDFYDGKPGAISAGDKTAYLASLPDISGLSTSDALRIIHEQHYIDLFTRGIDAWTLWKRTKTPTFELPVNAQLSSIIRRYPYPASETASNPNAPAQVPLDQPMWFEN